MRKLTCGVCGQEFPVGEMLRSGETNYCRPDAEAKAREAQAAKQKIQFNRLIDPTICAICKTDSGDRALPLVAGLPVCDNCKPALYARPYPAWLKASGVGLLALLAVALWLGAPYFAAGRHLTLGERALEARDYAAARAHFAEVLAVRPTDQRVVLEGTKAFLLAGDPIGADSFLTLREKFEENDLFTEVNGLIQRVGDALKKAGDATKLAQDNRYDDAVKLFRDAAAEYPESPGLAAAAMSAEATAAFERKDYDRMVTFSYSALTKQPGNPILAAAVASALACKFAVTGDSMWFRRAATMLARADSIARASGDTAGMADYDGRIHYRLATRQIIDVDEYRRRFPHGSGGH